MTRSLKDVTLNLLELVDGSEHFDDVGCEMVGDKSSMLTFAVDGVHYEVALSPMSAERKAEIYGE